MTHYANLLEKSKFNFHFSFIFYSKRNFTLLDWANILKDMNPNDVETVEQRTAILIREMHREHGVLYH
jgi:hypothetical protein